MKFSFWWQLSLISIHKSYSNKIISCHPQLKLSQSIPGLTKHFKNETLFARPIEFLKYCDWTLSYWQHLWNLFTTKCFRKGWKKKSYLKGFNFLLTLVVKGHSQFFRHKLMQMSRIKTHSLSPQYKISRVLTENIYQIFSKY